MTVSRGGKVSLERQDKEKQELQSQNDQRTFTLPPSSHDYGYATPTPFSCALLNWRISLNPERLVRVEGVS